MSVRLFVGNLPYDATEDDIRSHFSPAGNVLNVFLPLDRETGRKRGFAFVEYNSTTEAQEAIRLFNNQQFKGRPLAVNEARAREARPPGSAPPFRPSGPPRPMGSGPRPTSSSGAPPSRDFGRSEAPPEGRGDRPSRKQFGPDAKPFRNRNQRVFKPEGGKKAFKEKVGGQLHSVDDDEDLVTEGEEMDNFALGSEEPEDGQDAGQEHEQDDQE